MAGPLFTTYQRPWEFVEVPASWKVANDILIYKKSVRKDLENHRPLSLTSGPGKITEDVVLGAVKRHLKDSEIIRHWHLFLLRCQCWA